MYLSSKVFRAKTTQKKKTNNIYYNNYTKEATLRKGHLFYSLSRHINFRGIKYLQMFSYL